VQIDALFQLLFSDLRSDQYSLSRFEIKLKITPKWPGFHCDSMTIGPIVNRRTGDERGHQTAYFPYRLCHDTISTQILNCSKKCWMLRSWFCLETRCNGPDPNRAFRPVSNTTHNHENQGKTNNVGYSVFAVTWCMLDLVYAVLGVNSWSWHGEIERDNPTLCSVMIFEFWTRKRQMGDAGDTNVDDMSRNEHSGVQLARLGLADLVLG